MQIFKNTSLKGTHQTSNAPMDKGKTHPSEDGCESRKIFRWTKPFKNKYKAIKNELSK
jgi:hypothetical protein